MTEAKHKVLIATGGFKNFWTPEEASNFMAMGFKHESIEIEQIPVGDGGRGTIKALEKVFPNSTREYTQTVDALMKPIKAWYLIFEKDGEKNIYIEFASSGGMHLLHQTKPLETSSFGVGLLIKNALEKHNPQKIILGVGDSATTDGGMGILQALGVEFYNSKNELITKPGSGKILSQVSSIDSSNLPPSIANGDTQIEIYCDGDSIVIGEDGCWNRVTGKGGTTDDISILQPAIEHYFEVISNIGNKDAATASSSGCAGGVAGGLYGLLNAKLFLGSARILELVEFKKRVSQSSLILTGEGVVDKSTFTGKLPHQIAKIAQEMGIPALLMTTGVDTSMELALQFFAEIHIFEKNINILDKSGTHLIRTSQKISQLLVGQI